MQGKRLDRVNQLIKEEVSLLLQRELKDPRLGLVDFPSERDGRTVLLCWRLGEPEVQYWHELDSGYAGRQPLSPELVG